VKLDNDKIKPLEKGNTILAGNAKQKYRGSSAVSVSERKTKWTHAVRTTATNFRNYQITKNGPPGRNLGITLKINKWALLKETACNKMKSTTYPYHVVKFEKLDRCSQGVFVLKNQTKVTYPPSTTRARELQPPLYFRSQFLV
jgi:hypothetical protein